MEKRKITVDIAGCPITLVTDEAEEFVTLLTDTINGRVDDIKRSNFRISSHDACLLLTLEYLGDKLRAEEKVRELESTLATLNVTVENLREKLAEKEKKSDLSETETEQECERVLDVFESGESKIAALQKYIDEKNEHSGGRTREEKIRYIESLLRGNDNK